MAKEAVVSIVTSGNEVLVVLKKDDGGKSLMSNQWHLPGETMHEGEPPEDAVHRGINEEVEIKVIILNHLVDSESLKETPLHWYECEALSRNVVPGDDVVDAKFVPKLEVPKICSETAVSMWPIAIKKYFGLID